MSRSAGKILRIVAIILVGMTAVMNLLGGIGTSCAAFFTEDYPAMMSLYDYRWLYRALVVTTTLAGITGIWGTVVLARGKKNAFRNNVTILVIGTALALAHYIASQQLRGAAAPANVKFITNAFTLLYFAILSLPSIHQYVDFEAHEDSPDLAVGGGLAAIVAGGLVMTVNSWVGASHIFEGENWIVPIQQPLDLSAIFLILVGLITLVWALLTVIRSTRIQGRLPESKRV